MISRAGMRAMKRQRYVAAEREAADDGAAAGAVANLVEKSGHVGYCKRFAGIIHVAPPCDITR